METPTLSISFSGGRTSAFMTKFILEHPKYAHYRKVVVFANTGKERPETLDFIHECDKQWNLNVVWLEAVVHPQKGVGTTFKIVDYQTASRNGEPFEDVIRKYGIPNVSRPGCTRELKLRPIEKYMRSLGLKKWTSAIGIRYDERQRINWITAHKEGNIYPLASDIKCTKAFIRNWWHKQLFDLQLHDYEGNCDMCYKKSERKLLTLVLEKPELIQWWNRMETTYHDGKYSFYRGYTKAKDLVQKAHTTDFKRVTDTFSSQDFDPALDTEFDCLCKAS